MTLAAGELLAALGVAHPIVGAPMAGGPTTPALAAAVSDGGGLGSLAAGYSRPERLRDDLRDVRRLTGRPFAVNLFVPSTQQPVPVPEDLVAVIGRLRAEVGLPERPELPVPPAFDEQLATVLDDPPALVSFTFGAPPSAAIDALHAAGCLVGATATTAGEAVELAAGGVDVVCAQGAEAGGHRGGFHDGAGALVGTMALVPQVVDAVTVPVVAAGGIADGRGVAAALALGADAAQVGTAFLACPEAGTAPAFRQRIGTLRAEDLVLTDRVTGKPVRAVRNRLVDELAGIAPVPYPQLHAWTAELRQVAAAAGKVELMGMWAGQAASTAAAARPAAALVEEMAATARTILR